MKAHLLVIILIACACMQACAKEEKKAQALRIKKGGVMVQSEIPPSDLVTIQQDPAFFFLSVKADYPQRPGESFSNVPGEMNARIVEGNLNEVTEKWRALHLSQSSRRLIREIKSGDSVCWLIGHGAKRRKPHTYRGMQFIRFGDHVVIIDVMCFHEGKMPSKSKRHLNEILQSALKNMQVNGKPIDTSAIAEHVKRK